MGQVKVINRENYSDFWTKEIIIAEVEKTDKTLIRFSYCEKDDKQMYSLREFTRKNNSLVPTKKGFTFDKSLLNDLVSVLTIGKEY